MTLAIEPQLLAGSLVGLSGGLTLLVRGLGGYRTAARIADTPGSTISSLAVGEVRLTGVVEPAEMLLVSPLQSKPCIWYRSDVREARGRTETTVFSEERAIGFRLRDASGDVRVFPRGARWSVPNGFSGETGLMGDEPPGLDPRAGPAITEGQPDHAAQVAELLTVHTHDESLLTPLQRLGVAAGGRRAYREALIAPGDTITLLGFVEPFDQLPDPTGADEASGLAGAPGDGDPAIAADLAEVRASGTLAADPEEAWGNAAIPGFGIGQPVRAPHLDPAAHPMPLADAATAARTQRTFEIAPGDLIVATTTDVPLLISIGAATEAAAREDRRFYVGVLGAILSIGSAVVLAAAISGGIPRLMAYSVTAGFAVALLIFIVGFLILATYNAIVALRQRTDRAWANIDVVLKQRHDELPNLVNAVRGVMDYEQGVLEEVTRLRAAYSPDDPIDRQAATSLATSAAVRQLFAVVERYPDLKSQANVLALQAEIERLEGVISDRRELYNDTVYRYNTRIAQVPAVLMAWLFGWRPRPMFSATPEDATRPEVGLRPA